MGSLYLYLYVRIYRKLTAEEKDGDVEEEEEEYRIYVHRFDTVPKSFSFIYTEREERPVSKKKVGHDVVMGLPKRHYKEGNLLRIICTVYIYIY